MADRPHVTIYNEVSIDGRIGGFDQVPGRYYRLGFRWPADAILMGSVTALNFGPAESEEHQRHTRPPPDRLPVFAGFEELVTEPRPLLVVPDSGGSVRCWLDALAQPWYRSILVLVTERTPPDYLDYLTRRRVEHLVVGRARVDLAAALTLLHRQHGVSSIRTDGGGALNGALLAAGVVDEIVLVVNPAVSGLADAQSLVRLADDLSPHGIRLTLADVERRGDDAVLLRYAVSGRAVG